MNKSTNTLLQFLQKNQYTIILAIAACVVAAIIYRLYFDKTANEGFQSGVMNNQQMQDLLDKLKVDLYGKAPVWSNQLYRQQANIGEKPLSIWRPLNETGEPYRLLGHVVGDREDYAMPRETTMLVQGDTKPPINATKLFEFPQNIITQPNENMNMSSVYKGIQNLDDLEKRRQQLRANLSESEDTLSRLKTAMQALLNEVTIKTMQDKVELYGPDGFFQTPSVTIYLDETKRSMELPRGDYNSMRVPVGSMLTLMSENGGSLDINIPMDAVLDQNGNYVNNGEGPSIEDFYRYIDGIGQHDFRVTGKYCLRARDFFGNDNGSPINKSENSTVNRENAKDPNKVYMPFYRKTRKLAFAYNYNISTKNYPNNQNGRDDIYNYILNDIYTASNANSNKGEGRVGVDKISYKRDNNDFISLDKNASTQIRDALLYCKRDMVSMDNKPVATLIDQLDNMMKEEWVGGDASLLELKKILNELSKQTKVNINKYYFDMAFTFQTWIRYKKPDRGYKISFGKVEYDSRGERPYSLEMLYRSGPSNFYGRMRGGAISMLDSSTAKPPEIRQIENMSIMVNEIEDRTIAMYRRMLDNLDVIQRTVEAGTLKHFPVEIWRPIAPNGYTNLGDIAFNHEDPNYNKRQPQLASIACVPSQCVKEVRNWLPVDKVYEYRNTAASTGTYFAVYRNPYLQTFRISTQPGILPPGKVEKVVACVERCRVLDDIIEADKCAQEFYKANKKATAEYNLDSENIINNRESNIYKNRIREREDRINTLREVARRLQIQDDKAHIVNQEYNRSKFQKLVDEQRHNINALADRIDQQSHTIDVNVHFDYDKFQRLLYALRESEQLPMDLHDKLQSIVAKSVADQYTTNETPEPVKENDEMVRQLLGECPTPESQGLVLKSLVEAGCYNCANLI